MPICFDLDGTLGHFSSGFVLLREALGGLWGEAPSAEELGQCTGSTDWEIVDELHRLRFDRPLGETEYRAYEAACLARFRLAFAPGGLEAVAYRGILEAMHHLAARHQVWLVSGNAPALLAFKAEVLGIRPDIRRLGSLPGLSRTGLLQQARREAPGPHLYVGDRPHDRAAAQAADMPFIAIGTRVPGSHPTLGTDASAAEMIALAAVHAIAW